MNKGQRIQNLPLDPFGPDVPTASFVVVEMSFSSTWASRSGVSSVTMTLVADSDCFAILLGRTSILAINGEVFFVVAVIFLQFHRN